MIKMSIGKDVTRKVIKTWEYGKGWRTVEQVPTLKSGVYELPTGEIYVVKPNREHTRLYAKKLVEAPTKRLTETGEHVDFGFVYEPGAIYKLLPEHQMSLEQAKKLMIKYGKCIVCGRHLKVAQSVEQGMGPVCIKYVR